MAAQQPYSQQDATDQAWALLLQHPCLGANVGSICRLMCVSQTMYQAVHHHLAGQLQLSVSAEQYGGSKSSTHPLHPWLRRHTPLLKAFTFKQVSGLECSRPEKQQQIARVAAGLQAAGDSGRIRPLRLVSLTANVCAKVLLEALPAVGSTLTQLELGPFCTDELQKYLNSKAKPAHSSSSSTSSTTTSTALFPAEPACDADPPEQLGTTTTDTAPAGADAGAATAPAASATAAPAAGAPGTMQTHPDPQPFTAAAVLASLPALRTLVLHGYVANTLLPAVQSCSQVHRLDLCNLLCAKAQLLQTLPTQLQELRVSCDADYTSWQRKMRQPVLSHLSALTYLSCTGEGLFAVQADEVLPPNLVQLVVADCPKAAPLLSLTQLQVLAMQASTMDEHNLRQLRVGLPALREVQLGYERGNMEAISAASPGWPALAGLIRGLDLRVYPGPLPAQTLNHLGQLGPGLTRLAMSGFSVQVQATPAVFGAMLGCLSGLQELKLAYLRFMDQPMHPEGPPPHTPAVLGLIQQTAAAAAMDQATASMRAAAAAAETPAAAELAPAGAESEEAPPPKREEISLSTDSSSSSSSSIEDGTVLLMQQVAALPALTSISIHSMALTGAPVAALTAAGSRLSALQLNECDLCDADVALLAGRVKSLRRLALNWNFGVKSQGLGCLSELRGLRELHVCCGTTRHEAALADLQRLVPGLVAIS